jgi:hypothetical protein
MGTRSPSWAPGLIDRGRQRVRGIAFGGLTFKASQITKSGSRSGDTPRVLKLKQESPASAKEAGAGRRPDHREYPLHSSVSVLEVPARLSNSGLDGRRLGSYHQGSAVESCPSLSCLSSHVWGAAPQVILRSSPGGTSELIARQFGGGKPVINDTLYPRHT